MLDGVDILSKFLLLNMEFLNALILSLGIKLELIQKIKNHL